jgi:glycosyltransferase involved in cell wall biosynthesis
MEETVLKNADSVVVGNRRIKEKLIARYPFLTHGNVHIIPSGYDPYDFRLAARYPVPRGHRMRVTYSGLFSGGRSPKFMFQALAKIFAKHPETRDEIELCFVGPFPEPLRKLAAKLGVANSLVTPGYAEHHQSIRYLVASDLLWLTHYDPAITPGIVYEYMGTRKPILALVPPGGVRQILDTYDRATCVDPEDVEGIADALYDLYRQWSTGALTPSPQDIAGEYEQRHLVEQLARVLAYSLKI